MVDMVVLRETSFREQSQLEKVGASYTFFWSDIPKTDRSDAGIDFVIRNNIVGRPSCLSQDVNDCLIPLCLDIEPRRSTTILAAYEDIQEGQLVVLFLLHRKLYVREDRIQTFLECQQLIPVDNDEGIIHIPGPERRFVVLEDQRL
nr:unnamed protein product [Spirometra erinaceieuropaei]